MILATRIRAALVLVAGLAIALSGCSGSGIGEWTGLGSSNDIWKVDPNKAPANYKQDILEFLRTQLGDPTNIRGAFITAPELKPFGKESRYAVCVRYNARNLDGQYAGSKDAIAVYYGGALNQLRDATPDQCGTAAYQPFPELERLKRLDAR